MKRCCECRNGEHDDYGPVVGLCVVRDPETNRIVQRGYLCAEHVESRLNDGYNVHVPDARSGQVR
jgi:hypothetical protein